VLGDNLRRPGAGRRRSRVRAGGGHCDDPEERQRLIGRGRQRALDFDRGRVGRDYEELFVKSSRATSS
jgi:hypothetical protein